VDPDALRVGIGHDTHRLDPGGPLRLGGIDLPGDHHAVGHSDADCLLHAITDAVLGAAALGDIGDMFPETAESNRGRDSADMLTEAIARARQSGFRLVNLDCIVHLQRPKLTQYKQKMIDRIESIVGLPPYRIGLKAKTGEQVGPVGNSQVIMAECVALMYREP
jgi:2-C-methyl-D-erythritol 2,4-cyclodiphosphate synthase